jgi:hypothetical protein
MAGNKRLLIVRDKICTDQKYTQKVKWKRYTQKIKWKRSTELIFLKFSSKKWNIFYNFKVKCRRPLFLCLEVPNVYPPIAFVQIDSYSKVNKIHAAHFWVCMMATVAAFIDYKIRFDFRMGASTLNQKCGYKRHVVTSMTSSVFGKQKLQIVRTHSKINQIK